jgi:hypothetical protein
VIVKVSYIGGDSVFLFATAWKAGTYAGRTLASHKNLHYFLGEDDVYVWDGTFRESITKDRETGAYRVREELFNVLNKGQINNCFGILYEKFQEYWLFVVGSGETYPTHAFVYSIPRDCWFYFSFAATISVGWMHTNPGTTIDELIGTIDEQNWSFDQASMEGLTFTLLMSRNGTKQTQMLDETMGSDDGYLDATGTWHTGSDINTRLITRDFLYTTLPQQDRTERVTFEAYGTSVTVAYSNFYETNPASPPFLVSYAIALTAEYLERMYFPDAVGEHIRFMFTSTSFISLRWIQPYAIITEIVNE